MIEVLGFNTVLSIAIISWALAQFLKILICLIQYKKFDIGLMLSSGGMPSSHSSIVTSTACAIGFENGFSSTIFALAVVISLVVMYDASGVRRQAGLHAELLNNIVKKIEAHDLDVTEDLKVLLGHTPIQVFAGALLGILVAVYVYI
ncbi:MAG: divergent PAP2 family protein [Lachnospirales bacterium]